MPYLVGPAVQICGQRAADEARITTIRRDADELKGNQPLLYTRGNRRGKAGALGEEGYKGHAATLGALLGQLLGGGAHPGLTMG